MIEKTYSTRCGVIHYWVNAIPAEDPRTLVLLPGLTADHRLFEKQIEYFKGKYNLFVWDAPGHAASRPFRFDFSLMDKARWLDEILAMEGIRHPILIGQSMGGYVGQAYIEQFPGKLSGFISIDSAPLQRRYVSAAEIWLLKRTEPMYRAFPWKLLVKIGSDGVATTRYGRRLMRDMTMAYNWDHDYYMKLVSHGYRLLAEAMEADLPYEINCPALLICGEKDHAGSAKNYNKRWHAKSGLPIRWIAKAGHNSNTDKPDEVNAIIEDFITKETSC